MGKWQPVSEEMTEFMVESLKPFDVERRKMFGCPCWFVNSNMFTALHEDNIIVRLDEEGREEIFSNYDETYLFDPMGGRPMKEYVVLPESLHSDKVLFNKWLTRSYEYAKTIPPKKKIQSSQKASQTSRDKSLKEGKKK